MAEPADLLSTIVEFSIGLAGFSGVIGIFINQSGRWAYVDRFRITNLLIMSLTPGFMAFFTLGLMHASPGTQNAVNVSAGVFALILSVALVIIPKSRAKVPEQDKHLVGPKIFIPIAASFVIILSLQALIALSILSTQAFVIYYYSLVVMLLLAVVQFARLILARPNDLMDTSADGA